MQGLQALQGLEQLGEHNHRSNAAGQADKRGLRAGLEWQRGPSPRPSTWLFINIAECREADGGPEQPVVKYEGEVIMINCWILLVRGAGHSLS